VFHVSGNFGEFPFGDKQRTNFAAGALASTGLMYSIDKLFHRLLLVESTHQLQHELQVYQLKKRTIQPSIMANVSHVTGGLYTACSQAYM
jgi:hypothetical protein